MSLSKCRAGIERPQENDHTQITTDRLGFHNGARRFRTAPQVTLELNPVFRFLWRSCFFRCQDFQNIRPGNSRKAGKGNTYGVSVVRRELVCGIDGVEQHGRGAALRSQRRGGKGEEYHVQPPLPIRATETVARESKN